MHCLFGRQVLVNSILLLAFVFLLLTSCARFQDRTSTASELAAEGGLQSVVFNTGSFRLFGYGRFSAPGKPVTIYIEGDGLAYISRRKVSSDPTPINPLALQPAANDPARNVAYIARPCQYVDLKEEYLCQKEYWTTARFAEQVINAVNNAIETVAQTTRSRAIHLVGYSGGGAVVTLVAARRDDVASIRTIAGYLDPHALNRAKGVSPLRGSLDPMTIASQIRNVPQIHYNGSKDRTIPTWVADSFVRAVGNPSCAVRETVSATHEDGWVEYWKKSGTRLPVCR